MSLIRTIDIGNSRIKSAIFDNGRIIDRVSSPIEQYEAFIDTMNFCPHLSFCSVNVGITAYIMDKKSKLFNKYYETSAYNSPINIAYSTPNTLGADRIASACGVISLYASSEYEEAIVVDAGTAITCDIVDLKKRTFQGGVIMAGISIIKEGLHTRANGLPLMEKKNYPHYPAKSSKDCVDLGGYAQTAGALEHLITSYLKGAKGKKTIIVATGGDKPNLGLEHIFVEDLTHYGLEYAFRQNLIGEK